MPITGRPALPIATGVDPHWGLNDTIVYAELSTGDFYRVGSSSGEPELLLDSDTVFVRHPHLLPNGKAVVFSTATGGDPLDPRILVFEMKTSEVRELVASGSQPRYVPTGHLIFGHGDGALMGVPFDLETLQTTGAQVTLLPALTVLVNGASQFSVQQTGTLIYDGGAGGWCREAERLPGTTPGSGVSDGP